MIRYLPPLQVLSELRKKAQQASPTTDDHPAAASSKLGHELAQLPRAQWCAHTEVAVLRTVGELTGAPAATLTAETPLMEAGVDSLAATELSSRLRTLTG
eukprot:6414585-Prymnesium_polylepis.1